MCIDSEVTSIFQTTSHVDNFGSNQLLVEHRQPVILNSSQKNTNIIIIEQHTYNVFHTHCIRVMCIYMYTHTGRGS